MLVTGGASQAGSTVTYSIDQEFIGVAKHSHKMSDALNVVNYKVKEAANVVEEGLIWVPVTEAVAIDDTAYCVGKGSDRGKFNKTSGDTQLTTGGKFKSATSGAGLAKLKIRLL